jgi:moderate conductance mechanosensitive channel
MPVSPTAHAAAHLPAATAAVQATFAEQLTTFGRTAWDHLLSLDAREAGLNFLLTAAVALIALGSLWLLRRLMDRWLARFEAPVGATPDLHGGSRKAAGVTWGLIRLLILTGAVFVVMSVWGIDPWAWLSDGAGARLLRLALIVVLATALVEAAGFVIRRLVEGIASRSGNRRRAAQLRTLGPLLTGSAQGVLVVIGLLTFLSELGLKVGPLLASAGVVGIAVGFGAQTIVKDFLTGLFLIAEDVVSVGDNVRIGDASGVVETMTVRTIRLRSANGTLHIFPYSEAQVIHNRTKIFSSYLFEILVNYECDLDHALQIMRRVGEDLSADPAFKGTINRPFEVLGVDKLGPAGATLKARVTTEPQAQWRVGREYNRRLKVAFEAAGIGAALQSLAPRPPSLDQPMPAAREQRSFAPLERRPPS